MKKTPRGIRNHNPGNIRHGDPWQGLADEQPDAAFATFKSDAYGIRAIARTLITYQDTYSIRSIRAAITRWAPPVENDTESYVQAVATQCRRGPDEPLDMQRYRDLRPLVEAIIRHENGPGPLDTPSTWYDTKTVDKGMALAGVELPLRAAGPMPVTRETVGATSTGVIGVAQLAEMAPSMVDAITKQQDSLSSGQVSKIVIGLMLVVLSVFIAWSQVTKHKAGVL